jgi:hypothetical protein
MRRGVSVVVVAALLTPAPRADAAPCPHVVVFTLPGVSWYDVDEVRPPSLLAAIQAGAAGSVAVRTIGPHTTYAAGFATIGAGARADGDETTGGPAGRGRPAGPLQARVPVGGFSAVVRDAASAGYGAVPGALASALDDRPVVAVGNADLGTALPAVQRRGRWALLAAMDRGGVVALAATGPGMLRRSPGAPYGVETDPTGARRAIDAALARRCSTLVIDPGDTERADHLADVRDAALRGARRDALLSTDRLLAYVRGALDPAKDLLLIVSPTSPDWLPNAHLGVGVAVGPGFPAGSSLESASTRRPGVVTLPDIAPTVLAHHGIDRPPSMSGRPWFAADGSSDRLDSALRLDREATLIDTVKSFFVIAFIVVQVLLYAFVVWRLRQGREFSTSTRTRLEWIALGVMSLPVSAYLTGIFELHPFGVLGFIAVLLAVDALVVFVATRLARGWRARVLGVVAFSAGVVVADLVTGATLQFNSMFGYSPIVAGRFTGAGNHAFAVLGASVILAVGIAADKSGRSRTMLGAAAALFVIVIVVDGMPQFGSDVGGVIALVPALGITWMLLAGRSPSLGTVAVGALVALAVVALFLAIDLSRPVDQQTHLARLFEDVRARGPDVLTDTIERKAASNLSLLVSSTWTLLVPPALAAVVLLVGWPGERWRRLRGDRPMLRAGIVGALLLSALGFAVNDSGIGIPGMVLTFVAPMAVLMRLSDDDPTEPARAA